MRGPHWAIFLILIFSLVACKDLYTPPDEWVDEEGDDGVTYTNVVYSPDGKSVTLYLEGGVEVPNRQKRALSKELAIAGHDYFEVAFYYRSQSGNPANDIIVRTSWELNREARITGVRGKRDGDAGVNYQRSAVYHDVRNERQETIEIEVYDPETGTYHTETEIVTVVWYTVEHDLPVGQGAAILFVGRKTDKTLLGVGRLTNANGAGNAYTISPDTTQVTFSVAALECGLSPTTGPNAGENSFWTNFYRTGGIDETATNRQVVTMGGTDFYMYRLRDIKADGSTITGGEYEFRTSDGPLTDALRWGIILADAGTYERKQPRYPTANGQFQYFSVMLDDRTIITSNNNGNDSIGNPFRNPLELTFDTRYTVPGSVFALAFQIPVCPIFLGEGAGTWYIRASYDSYWLDLDDAGLSSGGRKGAGGAILFTSGKITEASAYRIRVVSKPYKYLYSFHTTNDTLNGPFSGGNPNSNASDMNPVNRYFNVNGLVVDLEYFDGTFIDHIPNEELSFEIGMKRIRPRVGAVPGEIIPEIVYSIQQVKVIYFHRESMITYEDSFFIIVDNRQRSYTGIPNTGIPPGGYGLPPNANINGNEPANTGYFPGSGIPMRNFLVVNNTAIDNNVFEGFLNARLTYTNPTRTIATFVVILDSTQAGTTANPTRYDFTIGPNLQFEGNNPYLILFVAGRPTGTGTYYPVSEDSLLMGRGSVSLNNGVFRGWGTRNAFFFGKWPFNDYLYGVPALSNTNYSGLGATARYDFVRPVPDMAGRSYHGTYSYRFDAYGPNAMNGAISPVGVNPSSGGDASTPKYFLNDGHGGRFYNVFAMDEEIVFHNRRWLN
jgi:hypothetical protein